MIIPGMDFFQPSVDDKSVQYLGQLFGQMGGLLPSPNFTTIIGMMFKTFNTIALGIGALIIVYMTVVGVMMTAHEGEFMKKWNSLWTPVRAVIGIASLFPTASGYCGIQLVMMWVIVQGIGAADSVWTSALRYVSVMGSAEAGIQSPEVGTKNAMTGLFKALVCEETAKVSLPMISETKDDVGSFYCGPENKGGSSWCQTVDKEPSGLNLAPEVNQKKFGPSGACGNIKYCDILTACAVPIIDPSLSAGAQDALKKRAEKICNTCKAQRAVLNDVIKGYRDIARRLVDDDIIYLNYYFKGSSTTSSKTNPPGFIKMWCDANEVGQDADGNSLCRGPAYSNGAAAFFGIGDKVVGGLPNPKPEKGSAPGGIAGSIYWGDIQFFLNSFASFPGFGDGLRPWYGKNGATSNYTPSDQFIPEAVNYYNQMLIKQTGMGLKNYQDQIVQQLQEAEPTGDLADANARGWIFAGAYYYYLVQANAQKIDDGLPKLEVLSINPDSASDESGTSEELKGHRNNYSAASAIIKAMQGSKSTDMGGADLNVLSDGTDAIGDMMAASTNSDEANKTNPLVQMASAGYWLLVVATLIYVAFMIVSLVFGLVSGINLFVLGTGAMNPMAVGMPMVWMVVVPLVAALLGLMVTMGATLGVYVPLIPYILFTVGALGWMISTVEAMVAGPLVAIGILAPGGHHEILGKAEPALMLLFGVFLRPTLMIFGLVISLLMASVAVKMINTAFWPLVVPQIASMGATGKAAGATKGAGTIASMAANPLMMVFFLIAYVGLIVSAVNKCFSMIHVVPERVMRWIVGQSDSYGESEAVGEMKSGVKGGASSAVSGAGQARKGGADWKDMKDKKAKGDEADVKPESGGGAGGGGSAGGGTPEDKS